MLVLHHVSVIARTSVVVFYLCNFVKFAFQVTTNAFVDDGWDIPLVRVGIHYICVVSFSFVTLNYLWLGECC